MYQIISAIAKPMGPGSPWTEVSVQNETISSLLSSYTEIYVRMSSPFWTSQRTVVFSALREMFTDTNITFNTFLTNLGNLTIPSVVGLASIQTGIVTFSDAVYAGYKVSRGRYSYNPAFVPEPSDADCAILTKTGVDARDVHKYCLVNVNGLIHRVDADSKYAYILDAAKSANYCKRNEIGIMSFAKIGALECVTLTEDCIGRMHPNQPMSNQISIKSPVDPKGRVAALVMGGYLFLMDEVSFSRCSHDRFVLDVQNIPIVDRFHESRRSMSMDFLGLDYNGANKAQISKAQLTSDAVMKKWLTCSQSFLVFIDTDNITVTREQLRDSRTYSDYIMSKEPKEPIFFASGQLPVYWKQEDEGKWLVSCGPNREYDYLTGTTPDELVPMPADNCRPYAPQKYRRAYLTHITTQKVVIK